MPRSSSHGLPYRAFPCGECPVRVDTAGEALSKFPAERWAELRRSIEDQPGEHATLGAPMFGCHEGEPGTGVDLLCAGWAAAFVRESVSLRIAVSMGLLPISVLDAGLL